MREKALALTRDEVPHAITVEVDELGEKVVRAILYVETESQKQILVGAGAGDGEGDRHAGAAGDRAPARPQGLPRAAGEGGPRWRRDERLLERLGI